MLAAASVVTSCCGHGAVSVVSVISKILWLCTQHYATFYSFRTATRFFWLCRVSLQDQYRDFMVRFMQSESPFQRWQLVCFHSNTIFFKTYNSLLCSKCTHKIWKRSVEKYKSYGTLSKTTHFLSVFCEASVVQQCTETQAGLVLDGLKTLK